MAEQSDTLNGLSESEARRLAQYGPNALAENRRSPLRQLLGYFWGRSPG